MAIAGRRKANMNLMVSTMASSVEPLLISNNAQKSFFGLLLLLFSYIPRLQNSVASLLGIGEKQVERISFFTFYPQWF
jgi:hypothetical protein